MNQRKNISPLLILGLWLAIGFLSSKILFANAAVCLPPSTNESTQHDVLEIYQAAAQPEQTEYNKIADTFYQYRRTQEKTDDVAALMARYGEDTFFAIDLLLGHYERWPSYAELKEGEKPKEKIVEIPEFAPGSDPRLMAILGLKNEASKKSLRYALFEEVLKDPAKLTKLQDISRIFGEFDEAISAVFTDDQYKVFFDNAYTRPTLKDGLVTPDETFATLGLMEEFVSRLRARNLIIADKELQGLSEDEKQRLYADRKALWAAQLQTDLRYAMGLAELGEGEKALERDLLSRQSLGKIVTGLRKLESMDASEYGDMDSAQSFLKQVGKIVQLPDGSQILEFIPEVLSNHVYGGSIIQQTKIMDGNRDSEGRADGKFNPQEYVQSLKLNELSEGYQENQSSSVRVILNRPAAVPYELEPPTPPQEPRGGMSNYDDSRVFISREDIKREEEGYASAMLSYEIALKKWKEEKESLYDQWAKEHTYKGRFPKEVANTSAHSIDVKVSSLEEMRRHQLAALVANANQENPSSNAINEDDYDLLSYSKNHLAKLHFIRQVIPSFNYKVPEKELDAVLKDVSAYKVSFNRVFLGLKPVAKFSSLEDFRAFKKAVEVELDSVSRLIPGIDPYFHGFCDNKPQSILLQAGEPKAVSISEYQSARLNAAAHNYTNCGFKSGREFFEGIKKFREGLEARQADLAKATQDSLKKFQAGFKSANIPKLLTDALTQYSKKTRELSDAKEAKEPEDKILALEAEVAQLTALKDGLKESMNVLTEKDLLILQEGEMSLSQALNRFDFKEFSIPQLQALQFVLSRYDWLDLYGDSERAPGVEYVQAETANELLSLVEWMAHYRPTSAGQTGALLLQAQRLYTDEGLLMYFAGEDWKKKLPLSRDGKRVSPHVVLSRAPFMREALQKLADYQIYARSVGMANIDGAFNAPPTVETERKVKEIRELFTLWGFTPTADQWRDFEIEVAKSIWNPHGKDSQEAFFEGVQGIKAGTRWVKGIHQPNGKSALEISREEAQKLGDYLNRKEWASYQYFEKVKSRLREWNVSASDGQLTNLQNKVPGLFGMPGDKSTKLTSNSDGSFYFRSELLKITSLTKEQSDVLAKDLAFIIENSGNPLDQSTKAVRGGATQGFNAWVRDYADYYKELGLSETAYRSGKRKWVGFRATRFTNELGTAETDMGPGPSAEQLKKQGQIINQSEKAEIAQAVINLRAAASQAMLAPTVPWDTLLGELFIPGSEISESYLHYFQKDDSGKLPSNIPVNLASAESRQLDPKAKVMMPGGLYRSLKMIGLKPDERMARAFQKTHNERWVETFNDEANLFFKAGHDVIQSYTSPESGALTHDQVLQVLREYRIDKKFRESFSAGYEQKLDGWDLRVALDHVGLGHLTFGVRKIPRALEKQMTAIRTFLVLGERLFDTTPDNPEGSAQVSEINFALGTELIEDSLHSKAIDQSKLPAVSRTNIVAAKLRNFHSRIGGEATKFDQWQKAAEILISSEGFDFDRFWQTVGDVITQNPTLSDRRRALEFWNLIPPKAAELPAMQALKTTLFSKRSGDYIFENEGDRDEETRQWIFGSSKNEERERRMLLAIDFINEDESALVEKSLEQWKKATAESSSAKPEDVKKPGMLSMLGGILGLTGNEKASAAQTHDELKDQILMSIRQQKAGYMQEIMGVISSEVMDRTDPWFAEFPGLNNPFSFAKGKADKDPMKTLQRLSGIIWEDPNSRVVKGDPRRSRGELLLEEIYGKAGLLTLKEMPKEEYEGILEQAHTAADLGQEFLAVLKEPGSLSVEILRAIQKDLSGINKANGEVYLEKLQDALGISDRKIMPTQEQVAKLGEEKLLAVEQAQIADSRYVDLSVLEAGIAERDPEKFKKLIEALKSKAKDKASVAQLEAANLDILSRQLQLLGSVNRMTGTAFMINQELANKFNVNARVGNATQQLMQGFLQTFGTAQLYSIAPKEVLEGIKRSNDLRMKQVVEMTRERNEHEWRTRSAGNWFLGQLMGGGKAVGNLVVGAGVGFGAMVLGRAAEYGVIQGTYLNYLSGRISEQEYMQTMATLGGWNEDGSQRELRPLDVFNSGLSEALAEGKGSQWLMDQYRVYSWVRQENIMTNWGMAGSMANQALAWGTVGISSISRPIAGVAAAPRGAALGTRFVERAVRASGSKLGRAGSWTGEKLGEGFRSSFTRTRPGYPLFPRLQAAGSFANQSFFFWNPRNWTRHIGELAERISGGRVGMPNLPLPLLSKRASPSRTLLDALKKERYAVQKPIPQGFMAKQQIIGEAAAANASLAAKAAQEATRTIGRLERSVIDRGAASRMMSPRLARAIDGQLHNIGPRARAQLLFFGGQGVLLTVPTILPHFMYAPEMVTQDEDYRLNAIGDQMIESVFVILSLSLLHRSSSWAAMKVPKNPGPFGKAGRWALLKGNPALSFAIMQHIGIGITSSAMPFMELATDSKRWDAFGGIGQANRDEILKNRPEAQADFSIIGNFLSQAALGWIIVKNNTWDELATGETKSQNPTAMERSGAKLGRLWREMSLGMPHQQIKEMRMLQNIPHEVMNDALTEQIALMSLQINDPARMPELRKTILDPANEKGLIRKIEMTLQEKMDARQIAEITKDFDAVWEKGMNRAQELRIKMENLRNGGDNLAAFTKFLASLPDQNGDGLVDTDVDEAQKSYQDLKAKMEEAGLPIEFFFTQQGDEVVAAVQQRLERIQYGKATDRSLVGVPDAVRRFGRNPRFLQDFLTEVTFDPTRIETARSQLEGSDGYIGYLMELLPEPGKNGEAQFIIKDKDGKPIALERRVFGVKPIKDILSTEPSPFEIDTVALEHDAFPQHVFEFSTSPSSGVTYRLYPNEIEFRAETGKRFLMVNDKGRMQVKMLRAGKEPILYDSLSEAFAILQDNGIYVGSRASDRMRDLSQFTSRQSNRPVKIIPVQGKLQIGKNVEVDYEFRMIEWSPFIFQTPQPDGSSLLKLKWPGEKPEDPRRDLYLPLLPGRKPKFFPEDHTIVIPMKNGLLIKINVETGKITRHAYHDLQTPIGPPVVADEFFTRSQQLASQNIMYFENELAQTAMQQGFFRFSPPDSLTEDYLKASDLIRDLDRLDMTRVDLTSFTKEQLEEAWKKQSDFWDPRNNPSPFAMRHYHEVNMAFRRLYAFFEATSRDFYEVIGVPKDATEKEIRDAHIAWLEKYQEATTKEGVTEEEVTQWDQELDRHHDAYEMLTDPRKRVMYDYMVGVRSPKKKKVNAEADAEAAAGKAPNSVRNRFDPKIDYYGVMGLERTGEDGRPISREVIRKRYLSLMEELHPDKVRQRVEAGEVSPDQEAVLLKQAQEVISAYGVLEDLGTRAQYDEARGFR